MKNLKMYFSIILTAVILTISTAVFAYDGSSIVFNDKIFMPESLVDGKVEVKVTRDVTNYTMYYEFVEINNSTYKEIVKLKDELKVAEYYNIWEDQDGLSNEETSNYKKYVEAYEAYKAKYGTTVDDYTDAHIDVVESKIVSLWASYTNNWSTASGNIASMDLSSFSGTKDFVLWVKVQDANATYYFADVYELTGTKSNQDNNNNTNTDNTNKDNTNKDNTTNNDKNNTNNSNNNVNSNSKNNSKGKSEAKNTMNDSTTSSTKTLPKTGISNIIMIFAFMTSIVAGISYVKYRKIK